MPVETLCAVLAACFMIGWNVMVTEDRPRTRPRPRRRHQRHRLSRRRSSHRSSSSSSHLAHKTTTAKPTTSNPSSEEEEEEEEEEDEEGDVDGEREQDRLVAAGPCGTPSTAPASSGNRSPVSPVAPAASSPPGPLPPPSSSPPPPPIVFQDLVLILDAPALPPPPWKLPNLPEEMDADTSSTAANMTVSPSRGCDLSPNFHLSAPWSPPARRGSWGGGSRGGLPRHHHRASPLGNRPRTFSEYSAGPPSATSPVPPLLQERSVSANTGLPSAGATVWGRESGHGEGEDLRLGVRARSFMCGDRDVDPFADWSGGGREEEEEEEDEDEEKAVAGKEDGAGVMVAAACVSPAGGGSSKVGGSENGGVGRPLSPFHDRRRHRSRPYFGR